MKLFYCLLVLTVTQVTEVVCHGYLRYPAQRSSAWLYNFGTPPNYNHMGLFCGGFAHQWSEKVDGRCGVCGDPWVGDSPSKTEPNADIGEKYVTNVITGKFVRGQTMNATVFITAYHKGWFEFRLCPLKNDQIKVTQKCLNQTLLQPVKPTSGKSGRIYLANENIHGPGMYNFSLQLPSHMTCDHCVLQWKYNTGNSDGCEDQHGKKKCGLGLGKQENFVNCADIQIKEDTFASVTDDPYNKYPTLYPGNDDKYPEYDVTDDYIITTESNKASDPDYGDKVNKEYDELPHILVCTGNEIACSVNAKSILAVHRGMDEWCCNNCLMNDNCDPNVCSCYKLIYS